MSPHDILDNPGQLQDLAVRKLALSQADFREQMLFIRDQRAQGKKWAASGVLVPLEQDRCSGEYVFVLNKRSTEVQQPGDLCCPGGRADRKQDRFLAQLLSWKILPSTRSASFRDLLRAEKQERDILLYIFAGCLRESWEEMRLKPWNVELVGALPTHPLINFARIIFPVVGRIRREWKPRPNWEVEKVIRLPLSAFFQPENYALCTMVLPPGARSKIGVDSWEVPCLVIPDAGAEEVLWGATFRILLTFMSRVLDLPIEQINPTRKIRRELPGHYYTGRGRVAARGASRG